MAAGKAVRYYFVGTYRRFRDEHIFFYASGISFNGILCILPFLLLSTSLLGLLLSSSELAIQKVHIALDQAFPQEQYPQQMKQALQKVVDDIMRNTSSYGIVGLIVLMWTSTSLFSALRSALNTIYRIATKKLLVVTVLEEVVLVMILGIVFFVSNFFIKFLEYFLFRWT